MGTNSIAQGIACIWPMIAGMVFSRAGLIVAGYGSYQNTDEGLYTDGAMLISLAVMLVLLVILRSSKVGMSGRSRSWLLYASIAIEAVCIVALSPDEAFFLPESTRLPLCTLATLSSTACQFFWLMRMRQCGGFLTALFAFGSLGISEVEIYICYLMGDMGYYLAALLVIAQLACYVATNRMHESNRPVGEERVFEFVGYAKDVFENNKILCITAVGLVLIYFVDGLLRGYPAGASIPFTFGARTANLVLTVTLCTLIIGLIAVKKLMPMGPATYISLELLAACALFLYAIFPAQLHVGAIFTTTLNALLCALLWYMVIAFMTFGWRDPYYYALGAWIVCMGSRAVARMVLIEVNVGLQGELAINAFMFAALLVSAQALLYGFFFDARRAAERASGEAEALEGELRGQIAELEGRLSEAEKQGTEESATVACTNCGKCRQAPGGESAQPGVNGVDTGMLSRLMGLDKPVMGESSPQATMRVRAEAVGKQFLLSEREIEVLSYYAMGWTQKRVAEELFIQPATVHAHIKRIYSKTGLHSRQEVLDFMEEYLG